MKNAFVKHHIKNILRFSLNTVSPLFSRKSGITPDAARERLQQVCPAPSGTMQGDNTLLPPSVDLQIVIPAYNAEAYLEECMESVLSQKTEYSYHIVLVDDGSRDNTPAICDRYSSNPRVTVIHQKNSGPAAARNAGLAELFGRYLMFVDADDVLCPGAVQAFLNTAYRHSCDIVEAGMYYLSPNGKTPAYRHATAKQLSDSYMLQGYPCGKIFRADLFRAVCFPEGYWYEDSIISFLINPSAVVIWAIPELLYEYRVNQAGMTSTTHGKPKSIDTYWITELLMQAHRDTGLPDNEAYFRYILQQFRLNQHRISDLAEEIQESVFVLSCQLLNRWFPENWQDRKYRALLNAMRSRDFGAFRMCCRQL